MKKLLCLILVVCLAPVIGLAESTDPFHSEEIFAEIDEMTLEELEAVFYPLESIYEYAKAQMEYLQSEERIANGEDIEIRTTADRRDPAIIGEPVMIEEKGIIITVEYLLQGTYANTVAKSFASYNTRYGMEKGQEWVLAYLKIEGTGDSDEKLSLSDWNFNIVDQDGIDCGNSYIADNPKEIRDMYGDSTQYAWYGMPVKEGTKACMIYQSNTYDDDTQYWFDLSKRMPVNTSNTTYEEVKLKSKEPIVFDIQMMLGEYGCMLKAPSEKYDTDTQNAMKKFQKKVGLKATGVGDEETLRILFSGKELPEQPSKK